MDYVPVYYVLHSSLSLDICCKVDRLELPGVVTEEVLAVATSGSNSNLLFDSSSSVTTRLLDEGELLLTAQVYCNGQPMHQVALATHTPSRSDAQRCTIEWYDLLRFPLRYRDIASDANIIFFVWGVDGGAIGGARLPLFDENGALRQGKQKLEFTWLPPAGSTESPVALTSSSSEMAMLSSDLGSLKEFCSLQNSSSMDPSLDREDHAFHLEKLMEAHELGDMPRIGWLDRMTLERARQLLDALRVSQSATMRQPCWSDEEWELRKRAFLVVDLPSFGLSVAHEEQRQSYPGSTAGGASMQHSIAATLPTITQDEAMSDGWPVPLIADFEVEDENPLEIKYRKLAHNILRGLVDPDLKPNREERERIDAVINSHSLGDHLRVEEKDLLWKFRHCLTDNKKALTKFLLSVDWTLDAEVVQVPALLAQWHQRAPIDVSDALKLLGRERAFQAKVVRDFAVDALERSSDSQLLAYLLQLVQALRYQPSSSSSSSNFPPEPETFLGVVDHDVTDLDQQKEPADSSSSHNSPLAQLLIRRACNSLQLASFLFWYLYVEQSDATHGGIFRSVFSAFQKAMSLNESSAPIISMLRRQKAYVSRIATVHKEAATTRGRKPQKEAKLRELLQNPSLKRLQEALPFPLDPSIRITGLQPESAFMFKSALYPCVIDFSVTKISKDKEPYCDDEAMTEPPGDDATGSYKVIFKTGDDLRQDQLMIQMISLMDGLLKQVNLDLRLRPYHILATGARDGLVEFVEGSLPISAILKNYQNSILEFLRHHNPDPESPLGVHRAAISTFVKSTAGYCVITYLLGIGDRHLDNLMILPEGNLFHIDFGYILGADPKPLAPPFRFTKEMVEAMGGIDSENYQRFRAYCCQAYTWLRKSASLILNLLNLMVDAGIEELSADPVTVLGRVEEKFRLDLTDEQAEHFFLSLVDESLRALAPMVLEKMHQFAVARR